MTTGATFTTEDVLNRESPAFRLQSLILSEVFLAGKPCDIVRLWSEMFERQKTINVGTLLFAREVCQLERQDLLQPIGQGQTAITKKGEIHLFGILLLGLMPEEALWKLEARGVLDVAQQQEQPTKAVAHESGTGVVANRKPLTNTNCDTKPLDDDLIICDVASQEAAGVSGSGSLAASRDKAVNTGRGHASPVLESETPSSPADSEFNVADVSPVPASAGGEVRHPPSSPLHKFTGEGFRELDNAARYTGKGTAVTSPVIQFPADDDLRWADNVSRFVDTVLKAKQGPHDEEEEDDDDGGIFGTGDPDEMAHSQHGYGREM